MSTPFFVKINPTKVLRWAMLPIGFLFKSYQKFASLLWSVFTKGRNSNIKIVIFILLSWQSLHSMVNKENRKALEKDVILSLTLDICSGLDFLESKNVIHFDIKRMYYMFFVVIFTCSKHFSQVALCMCILHVHKVLILRYLQ